VHWSELGERALPLLVFVLAISVVAELASRAGVFESIADRMALAARGSVVGLWLLVVLLATAATAVLSLDTTAVLLTPVVLALATQLGLPPMVFAFTTVWLANTASLFLPVSNLTNLLSLHVLAETEGEFVRLTWPAAVTAVVVTVLALAMFFRTSLRGRYDREPPPHPHDRTLLVVAFVVCGALAVAFALGAEIAVTSGVGALVLVVAFALRDRAGLRWALVPGRLLVGLALLLVLGEAVRAGGLLDGLSDAAGSGTGVADLLRLAGLGAVGSNLVSNLPAYLALEPAVHGSADRLAALLVGVNVGPLVTPWASLATLLWASRCRAAGVEVDWRGFVLRGLVLAPVAVVASVLALAAFSPHAG
jgi:arsenical pump membrane protein